MAYALRPTPPLAGENWSGDVDSRPVGKKEFVFTSDDGDRHVVDTTGGLTLPYRCVFYQAN